MKTSFSSEQNLELFKSDFINSYAEYNVVILFSILFFIIIIQFFLLRNEHKKYNVSNPNPIKMLLCYALLSLFFTSCQLKTYPQTDENISARKSCNAMSHCSATSSRNSLNDFSHSNHSQYKYCVCCGQKITKRF
jgi:hypothetical protein